MSQHIFTVRHGAITATYQPPNLDYAIERHEVIRQTPKGYRLKYHNGNQDSMYLHEHYAFFETRAAALEHLADMANRVAAELEEMKLAATRLLCDAHDALRAELAS